MRGTNPIAALLGSSPFKPMQLHMRSVRACVSHMPALFAALIAEDDAALHQAKEAIFAGEHDADTLKNELRAHLPKGLFMPVDRRDLLALLDCQDDVANTAQDIAGLLTQRKMDLPEPMRAPMQAFVQRCVDCANQAADIIEELDELVEMGFRGREVTRVDEMIVALIVIENETDRMGIALCQTLFSLEESISPVTLMLWYDLIHEIGAIADHAEAVGNRLRLLMAR
ncbi:MAG: TIGR00153 family protein [Gammaproteobacteria bacterium]|nr:TIGR00153 family protein [Gammaproteobacteria bacterium]